MNKSQSPMLDELLPGMRVAFFEVIWPTFRWIQGIWIKENEDQFDLFVETTTPQDDKEWDDFDYLAGRVFKVAEKLLDESAPDSKHEIKHSIQHGSSVPKDGGYRELMSDRVFKMIAKRHAPWRLEDGR